jgi:exonuclease VII small subunit
MTKSTGKGRGGKRKGAGRKPTFEPLSPGLLPPPLMHTVTRLEFSQAALNYSLEALQTLVALMRHSESDVAKATAADKILDRGLGKAPQTIDARVEHHTEIVYQTAEQIKQELIARGVPRLLIEATVGDDATTTNNGEPEPAESE